MKRRAFVIPYGLLVALGVYGLLVLLYVWRTYWNSPEYLAAEHLAAANELVGDDDGKKASKDTLTQAYVHYLEAARLMPRITFLHKRVEAMRWRFEERGFKMDHDLQMRAEAVAMLWQRIQQEQEPMLVVGARDRGWNAAAMLEGPQQTVLYSLPGLVAIAGIWAALRYSARRVKERDHEAQLKTLEQDVVARGAQRRPPLKEKR